MLQGGQSPAQRSSWRRQMPEPLVSSRWPHRACGAWAGSARPCYHRWLHVCLASQKTMLFHHAAALAQPRLQSQECLFVQHRSGPACHHCCRAEGCATSSNQSWARSKVRPLGGHNPRVWCRLLDRRRCVLSCQPQFCASKHTSSWAAGTRLPLMHLDAVLQKSQRTAGKGSQKPGASP